MGQEAAQGMRSGQGWKEASGDTEEGHRGEQGTPGGSQVSGMEETKGGRCALRECQVCVWGVTTFVIVRVAVPSLCVSPSRDPSSCPHTAH